MGHLSYTALVLILFLLMCTGDDASKGDDKE